MDENKLRQLLTSIEEDEQRDLCDQRMQGKKSAAEVDAALAAASPTLQALRRHSEPLRESFQQRLVDQLLAAPEAPRVDIAAPLPTRAPELRQRRPRSRAVWYGSAALLAAAGVAIVAAPSLLGPDELPQMSLELAEHKAQLLGPAARPSATAELTVNRGGCIALALRPQKSYDHELQTQVVLFQDPARPLTWPIPLQRAATGVLRQQGACVPLPAAASAGDWTLVVTYGRTLPSPADAVRAVAAGTPGSRTWSYTTQRLHIDSAATQVP